VGAKAEESACVKIGILAGTFDPVHIGHLDFVQKLVDRNSLDKVVFMPERQPRRKQSVTSFTNRLAMLRKAVSGNGQFVVYDTGENYFSLTKTIPKLENRYKSADFVILVGSDVARRLSDWPGIDKLKPNISFMVALRTGDTEMSVRDELSQPAIKPRVSYLNSPEPQVAASLIRAGEMKSGIAAVDRYIAEHHLYD
jgi:nicotinate-nucleotide adenylyltransferase